MAGEPAGGFPVLHWISVWEWDAISHGMPAISTVTSSGVMPNPEPLTVIRVPPSEPPAEGATLWMSEYVCCVCVCVCNQHSHMQWTLYHYDVMGGKSEH